MTIGKSNSTLAIEAATQCSANSKPSFKKSPLKIRYTLEIMQGHHEHSLNTLYRSNLVLVINISTKNRRSSPTTVVNNRGIFVTIPLTSMKMWCAPQGSQHPREIQEILRRASDQCNNIIRCDGVTT